VTIADLGRYSQEIEGAVYFCCLEALQNAAKHADGATGVALTLAEDDDAQLSFEVRDDGSGLARAASGAGLTNMRDRIAAVGGSLSVDGSPDGGTRVRGQVPLAPVELTPELESLLRRATDALDDCFGIFGAVRDQRGSVVDFLVEHVNEAACLDLGLSHEGEIGRTLGELVPGYKDSEAFRWHRHVLAGNQPMSREDLSYSGSLEDASHLKLAYDVRGASLGGGRLVLSWRDITKRKRTELDLRLQSLVLARAAEGVCLIRSSDAVIVYANPRYAEIFGYAPGELDGRPVSVLNSEEHPGEAVRRAREIIKVLGERGEASFEIRMRRKDGTSIWTEGRAVGFEHPEYGKVWVSVQQRMAQPNKAVSANGDGPRPLAQPRRGL
jgi:PAS domain S-box-containing protein